MKKISKEFPCGNLYMTNNICKSWKVVKDDMKKKNVTENVVYGCVTAIDNI